MEAAWQPVADGPRRLGAGGGPGDRGARRAPALPAAAGRGVRPGRAGRCRRPRGAAHPQLPARPAPGLVDAARRRHRPRRGAADTRWCARSGRRRVSTAPSVRCWTSAPPTSRAPPRRGAARTSTRCRSSSTPPCSDGRTGRPGGRRHHRRGRVGAGRRRSATTRTGSATWSGRRSPPASVGWIREGDGLHLRRTRAQVRARRVRRGGPRPRVVRRPPGAAGDRPRRRGDRPPGADRRAGLAARHRGGDLRPGAGRADRRVARRGDRVRPRRQLRASPSTRSWRSAAARRSTPPRRSTCCSPTPAS